MVVPDADQIGKGNGQAKISKRGVQAQGEKKDMEMQSLEKCSISNRDNSGREENRVLLNAGVCYMESE